MTENRRDPSEPWYRANAKNMTIFALTWVGEMFLILLFAKWVIHGSAAFYLLLVPWSLLGLIVVIRPNWIVHMNDSLEHWNNKLMEQAGALFEKRPPPGFP